MKTRLNHNIGYQPYVKVHSDLYNELWEMWGVATNFSMPTVPIFVEINRQLRTQLDITFDRHLNKIMDTLYK